tara:strand:+ start:6948 stop:7625 length:678 start_codon:yes stop_codon:yes gene_type:complete
MSSNNKTKSENLTLYLYRHGNTFDTGDKIVQVGLKSDLALTQRGEEQANLLGQYLQAHNITPSYIYSGSLQRQTKSLELLKTYYPDTPAQTHISALDEIDYGLWEGLSSDEIKQQWPEQDLSWQHQTKWQDNIFIGSQQDHTDKLLTFFDTLRQNQAQANTQSPQILISSNGIIRYFLYFTEKWDQLVSDHAMLELKVKTGHFCKVILDQNNKIHVEAWNIKPKP